MLSTPNTPLSTLPVGSKGLVINYGEGGGLQNGKIGSPKQDRVKLFAPPPFQRVETFCAPLQYG